MTESVEVDRPMLTQKVSLRDELLRRRYLLKDAQGRVVETPPQMFSRVAGAVAGVEAKYDAAPDQVRDLAAQFFRLMSQGRFLPNSPTLM
ncbi:MAG: ribonucleotide-diphosphate reductase subunit alpha, partial [Planctomycetes bacterium]|nr:ribonucleotide-diphosphate reductase subunit alpha [Planctomycetota bacterium]